MRHAPPFTSPPPHCAAAAARFSRCVGCFPHPRLRSPLRRPRQCLERLRVGGEGAGAAERQDAAGLRYEGVDAAQVLYGRRAVVAVPGAAGPDPGAAGLGARAGAGAAMRSLAPGLTRGAASVAHGRRAAGATCAGVRAPRVKPGGRLRAGRGSDRRAGCRCAGGRLAGPHVAWGVSRHAALAVGVAPARAAIWSSTRWVTASRGVAAAAITGCGGRLAGMGRLGTNTSRLGPRCGGWVWRARRARRRPGPAVDAGRGSGPARLPPAAMGEPASP